LASTEVLLVLNKYKVPKDRLYTETHEWVKVEDGCALIGITDYAQAKLKNIVGIELPEKGTEVGKGGRLAVVESIKSVEDVYAPITCRVIEVNKRLESEPELLNNDPYGEGWIARVEIIDEKELESLLKPEDYAKVIEREESEGK